MPPILKIRSWLRLSPRRHTLTTSSRRKCLLVCEGSAAVALLCVVALQPLDVHAVPPATAPAPAPYVHTSRRSAAVQSPRGVPVIVATSGPSKLDDGRAVRTSVRFDVANVTSACSDGGTPLAPLVLWGYDDALTMASVGLIPEAPRDGFRPVPSRRVLRTDTFGSNSQYVRTFVATREVQQPQREWTEPFLGVTYRGVAATMVLADVYGRCRFGDDVVVGTEPMWVPNSGLPALFVSVTDEATQLANPVDCSFGIAPCPVSVTPGPGGSRWR